MLLVHATVTGPVIVCISAVYRDFVAAHSDVVCTSSKMDTHTDFSRDASHERRGMPIIPGTVYEDILRELLRVCIWDRLEQFIRSNKYNDNCNRSRVKANSEVEQYKKGMVSARFVGNIVVSITHSNHVHLSDYTHVV